MILYGLKNCDTCRTALKALSAAGLTVDFRDIRADGVMPADLDAWLAALGPEKLVNRRSTTWRSLDAATRDAAMNAASAAGVLAAHPTLIKRPVIVSGEQVTVGWTPALLEDLRGQA